MERQKFEESLKKTFDQAGFTPSDKVWTNIELDLERLERGNMERRLTFFKFLAAASVIFALGVAGTGIYMLTADPSGTTELTAQQHQATDSPQNSKAPGAPSLPSDNEATAESQVTADNKAYSPETRMNQDESDEGSDALQQSGSTPAAGAVAEASPDAVTEATGVIGVTAASQEAEGETLAKVLSPTATAGNDGAPEPLRMAAFREQQLPPLVKPKKIVPHFPKTEPDQIDLLLASIEMEERASREKKKFDDEKVWTSVGFSTGTFSNPNAGGRTSVMNTMTMNTNFTSANTTLVNETQASGVSYSVGVNVGGKIAPRWVLQGGINYMTQNAAFTSDAVVTDDYQNFKAAYSAEITKVADASSRVIPTAPYSVTNNMEYLSVPMQAGYILVNRAFGLQINGGVSTDLFIQNTLEPESGYLDKVTNGRGSDSPYRPVNFSGLVGTEFSYRFSDHYRLSVNPGIRYPFSSIYKSDVGLSVTPVTFDVGIRFKYIFQ